MGKRSAFSSIADWVEMELAVPDIPAWRLDEAGYQAAIEHDVESWFAISNGFLGVRGSLEPPTIASRPRTFIAGLFTTPPGDSAVPRLVRGPDWLRLNLSVAGQPLSLTSGQTLTHRRTLDFQRGLLISEWQQCNPVGRFVRVRTLRFASLVRRTLAVQIVRIEVEQAANITLEAWLEPVTDELSSVQVSPMLTIWRTDNPAQYLAVANRMILGVGRRTITPNIDPTGRHAWDWKAGPSQPAVFTRVVAVKRADQGDDGGATALRLMYRARQTGLPRLLDAHTRAWADRWHASDVIIDGDAKAQQALRFALYHLISAVNPGDPRTSIGARALTGDAYMGHVFWDTEIFLLPFYTYTWPEAARTLLLYRWHTLPAARVKAARLGYRGALYAWESADTGEEATPQYVRGPDGRAIKVRSGAEEQHISADIAYAVWQYWQATNDVPFLLDAGAEIILETARFWASRATLEADGRYHIRGVIGPDEYHEGVDDNAYTNGLARWNIERGLEVAELFQTMGLERWSMLRQQLGITTAELVEWRDVATRLVTGLDTTSGLLEQFDGFSALEPIDLAAYTPRTAPLDVILGRARTQQSQVIKQADVVMLLALLWDRYSAEIRAANFHYYEPRCGHDSSLSPAMHALVAARLGEVELAMHYFHEAANIDLNDTMGNAAGGIHIATLGGLWQAAVFGFGGITLGADWLRCDPHLPATWHSLQFPIRWREHWVRITIQQPPLTCTVALEQGQPLVVEIGDLRHLLSVDRSWTCRWNPSAQCWEAIDP